MDIKKLEEIHSEIEAIRRSAVRLQELSDGIQAIDRNVYRILASTKMLELNISDLFHLTGK